jgi:hypothetical protein
MTKLLQQYPSPVRWARYGKLSEWIANLVKPQNPPVLILAHGRSGSTWVGTVLGRAANALYMGEPITKALPPSAANAPDYMDTLKQIADAAYLGWPRFPKDVCIYPEQWNFRKRFSSRVVMKEVHMACAFHIYNYRPRMIFLVRHPIGIALSVRHLRKVTDSSDALAKRCRSIAERWQDAYQHLKKYSNHIVVRYEDLCADPVNRFRELYVYAGLQWDAQAEQFVIEHNQEGDRSQPFNTTRNSQDMINIWRSEVTPEELEAARATYFEFDLPWYRSAADW